MPFDLANWLLVFLRLGALLSVFPLFTMPSFPVQLRVALAALAAFLIAPMLPPLALLPASLAGLVGLMAMELGVGLLLGFVSRLMFYILEFAGGVISSEIGFNMAASISLLDNARSEVPGLLLFFLGGVIFLSMDLHHWAILAIQQSYTVLPFGGARLNAGLFHDIMARTSQIFVIGVMLSAPVIAVTFLVNLVFSVIGRAVPQMNIFIESLAFRILAGLMVFSLTLSLMAQHIVNYLRHLPEDLAVVIRLLGG